VSADSEAPDSPSLRYWKAAISALPAEKRDAAWEFYLTHLAEGDTGNTLSALILLLEANSVYLERLPERYQEELIKPLSAQLIGLVQRLAEHEEHERGIAAALERASERNVDASARVLATSIKVEGSLREAATAIDAKAVVEEVRKQIKDGALEPLERHLQQLASTSNQITEATNAARIAVDAWRRVHLGGIILAGWGIGAVIFAALFLFAWTRWERNAERHFMRMRDQLTADVWENQATVRKLIDAGVSIRVISTAGSISNAVVIEPAEGADFDARNGHNCGLVFLKPMTGN
jgi:hypothetical protein